MERMLNVFPPAVHRVKSQADAPAAPADQRQSISVLLFWPIFSVFPQGFSQLQETIEEMFKKPFE